MCWNKIVNVKYIKRVERDFCNLQVLFKFLINEADQLDSYKVQTS
jgi:hypothetical protein